MCNLVRRLVCLFLIWNMARVVSSAVVIGIDSNSLVAALVGKINNQTLDALIIRLRNLQGADSQVNDHDKGSCELALEILTVNYGSIDNQLKALQMTIDTQSQLLQQINKERAAIEDQNVIAQAIKSNQFKLAEEKLIRIDDLSKIRQIIYNAYGNSVNNIDAIVDFARGLANLTHSFHVMKSLYTAMAINGINDTAKFIELAEALKSKIIVLHNDPRTIKAEAVAIYNELMDLIKTKATTFLIEAMQSDNYQRNTEVHSLAASIYNLSPELSDVVMQRMVDGSYDSLDPYQILANILSLSKTEQIIPAISTLFWNIKMFGDFNSAVIFNLAINLSKMKDRNDFAGLSRGSKGAYDRVVENLPKCAKNLIFEPYVCLWNTDKNSYLHAAESSFNDMEDRRNIFTSPASGNVPTSAAWFVENNGNRFLFRSKKFTNEYMYVAYEYDSNMRYVFSWIPGNNTDDQSIFRVELEGDHCYLRGVYFTEYLFASEVKFKDSSYKYAFTWRDGTKRGQSGFLWQVRSCDV